MSLPKWRTIIGPYFGNINRNYLNNMFKNILGLDGWKLFDISLDEDDNDLTGLEIKTCNIQN